MTLFDAADGILTSPFSIGFSDTSPSARRRTVFANAWAGRVIRPGAFTPAWAATLGILVSVLPAVQAKACSCASLTRWLMDEIGIFWIGN